MKYWKQHAAKYLNVVVTPADLARNRKLRLFKHIRTFFVFFNPAVSIVLLSMLFTGVI